MTDEILTQSRLHELFNYDGKNLIWKVRRKGTKGIGSIAGCIDWPKGYRRVHVDGVLYLAHRLVWLYHNGQFPTDQIDHINGIKDDNRIENLRSVDNQTNNRNKARAKNNTSGITGISWSEGRRKWEAKITIDGKSVFLGRFDCKYRAASIRELAGVLYDFHPTHGRS